MMKKIWSSFAATTAMTVFSYLLSFLSDSNLKEPHILGQLAGRLMPWKSKKEKEFTGWIMHYAVGLLFTEMYISFCKHSSFDSKKKTGLVYGGLSGLAAILLWKFTFTVHPFPPAIHFGLFSLNLFLCHVVFGFVSALTLGN